MTEALYHLFGLTLWVLLHLSKFRAKLSVPWECNLLLIHSHMFSQSISLQHTPLLLPICTCIALFLPMVAFFVHVLSIIPWFPPLHGATPNLCLLHLSLVYCTHNTCIFLFLFFIFIGLYTTTHLSLHMHISYMHFVLLSFLSLSDIQQFITSIL